MNQVSSAVLLALLCFAGCAKHSDLVCESIGSCRALSDDQQRSCKMSARALGVEAAANDCTPAYDDYFDCADSKFDCQGNVPGFPGCEPKRAALDACLIKARRPGSCGTLAAALAACPGAPPADPSAPPLPCGAAELCTAQCYLDNVPHVCAPAPAQLTAAAQCSAGCPL